MNNFTELGKEHEDRFNRERKETVRAGIWSTLGTFRYVGDIFDVYVPKFIRFLVGLSGGDTTRIGGTTRKDPASGGRGMLPGNGVADHGEGLRGGETVNEKNNSEDN